jgi:hypothetical protein
MPGLNLQQSGLDDCWSGAALPGKCSNSATDLAVAACCANVLNNISHVDCLHLHIDLLVQLVRQRLVSSKDVRHAAQPPLKRPGDAGRVLIQHPSTTSDNQVRGARP